MLRLASRPLAAAARQDLVIIGGGPGGYVAAIKAAQLGLKVTCVEGRGALGGTCLNVGCIPSKALLHSSHMYAEASTSFAKHGINVSGLSLDFPAMMKQKSDAVSGLTKGIEGLFKKNKVEYVRGWGVVASGTRVTVRGEDGATTEIDTERIMIATGSEPTPLPGIEIDEQRIVSSTGALALTEVPKRMVVVGAGVIGLELGSVYARLGTEVEVVEFTGGVCTGALDAEIAKAFQKSLEKQGLKFHFNAKMTGAKTSADGGSVSYSYEQKGKEHAAEADVVLIAIGRRPFTQGLGLENIDADVDKAGRIVVNDRFETKTASVLAIGDVINGPMLAHKAEEEGVAAAEMIATGHGHVNYDCIPGVIYTDPEVATVGKTEEELKAAGVKYKAGKFPFMANSRARAVGTADGLVKVLADAETDRILGVHIVATGAGEMIAEAVLAMEYGASSEDVARTCHAHPTMSEAIKEAAMATYNKPIHM
eukprot:TRINITY_DN14688_c0_g2_i1.p1 TRINITY_DN14688_c0_g2~~TRINITY_DN14688_c0_g2_i1.p1  ORF type:complete len:509 (-),score=306.29 TRINITY_DN14688_c0_g2_i1:30-1469(-)